MAVDLPYNQAEYACMIRAEAEYQVPALVLAAILKVEGGRNGMASPNTNKTFDYGRTQINTVWVNNFYRWHGVPPAAIAMDSCTAIRAAAYIVQYEYRKTGNFWTAIGNYHSRTPDKHRGYVDKIYKAMVVIAR